MLYSQQEVFIELGITLDQLLDSAKILRQKKEFLSETELELLIKTQESLVEHFIHTKVHFLQSKKKERQKKLEDKLSILKSLDPASFKRLSQEEAKDPVIGTRPRIGRNRKSSKSGEFAYCHF